MVITIYLKFQYAAGIHRQKPFDRGLDSLIPLRLMNRFENWFGVGRKFVPVVVISQVCQTG